MRLWIAFQIPLIMTSISLKDKPDPMKAQLHCYYGCSPKVVVFKNGHSVPIFAKRKSSSAAHTLFGLYLRTLRNPSSQLKARLLPSFPPRRWSLPKYNPSNKAFSHVVGNRGIGHLDSVTQLIEAPIGHVQSGRCEGRVVEAVSVHQPPCTHTTFGTKKSTHRASKPRHSKRSDVEFTWTNRPKNETHPGVALHVN